MKIKYLLQNVDMRCNQKGLSLILESKKSVKLNENDFALFLNRKQTQLKLLSWDRQMCISYKAPGYGRLNPMLFTTIHKYWDGKTIDFKKAEKTALLKSLKLKGKRKK